MPSSARERRRRRRKKTRRAAWIRGDRDDLLPCVIWDESETGARIAAAHSGRLPDVVSLVTDKDSTRLCRIVWRKNSLVGVHFIAADEVDRVRAAAKAAKYQEAQCPPASLAGITLAVARADDASDTRDYPVSWVAASFVVALVALTILLYWAGSESPSGAAWAARVCGKAGTLCQHPELPGGAAILMAAVYLAVRGMEL